MGILDLFKKKQPDPQPVVQPSAQPSSQAPAKVFPPYRVAFEVRMPYYDPKYRIIQISASGETEVSSALFRNAEEGTEAVQNKVKSALIQEITKFCDEGCSAKDLASRTAELEQKCVQLLKEEEFEVFSLAVTSVGPTPLSRPTIELTDKRERAAASKPKFCPNCGSPTKGAKFCSNCGTKL